MLNKGMLRGFLIALFFGVVLFALIPIHVPRPSFIPGFAPPPDMWPRTVSILGLALGILAMVLVALSGGRTAPEEAEYSPASPAEWRNRLIRLALALAAFAGFVFLAPRLGFLPSSMLLALAAFILAGASSRWVAVLALAVLLPLGLQLFFGNVTHTPFPQGSWGIFPTFN
ncbi:tripartite tricarboxylate transporter TctB family protein [Nitratireductor sp. GZWM139]|uniref:tripartite tricarboxylate transporter TctB family protein n=1 Tax=Nitratireductor sp. GZWM139 TaxID=2950541 RepID=UPI0024BE4752|nr:tripartite tricarboxylate transporter TctB family protein [Nitratireductor sp. GZWM139]MDJ1465191.1 tripartite tricarboxylate transporter TctB family protein [Nitratireductor sp. GZWM139]